MKQYIVDAFADKPFCGNPAAVCVMDWWLSDATMQALAMENNLAGTAFIEKEGECCRIRRFTPGMKLCGHAARTTSFVILHHTEPVAEEQRYTSQRGDLAVRRKGDLFEPIFPTCE